MREKEGKKYLKSETINREKPLSATMSCWTEHIATDKNL